MLKSIVSFTILLNAVVTLPEIGQTLVPTPPTSQTFVNSEVIAQNSLDRSDITEFIQKLQTYTNLNRRQQLQDAIETDADLVVTSAVGEEPLAVKIVTLVQSFQEDVATLKDYNLKLKINSIEIQGNTATVRGTSIDRATANNGAIINTDSIWNSQIIQRDGKLLITKWHSNMVGYSIRAK